MGSCGMLEHQQRPEASNKYPVNCMHAGSIDTMHGAITTVPTTVDTHDSHFGAAAGQDAADVPAAIYGGDNA